MLSKEEYKKALDNIKLNYDAEYVNECNDEFCQAMKGYISVIENLIKEHFELVEKYEMLDNTYSMICEDYLNPQPYKFEELKVGMWVWDSKFNKCNLIVEILDNEILGFYYIMDNVLRYRNAYEENRFYPVQMANVRCE